ncbi:iron-siderophore ABC transporter substrate-binding protein [Chlorogloeopsis sp. ULAP01]|uniref:ABC transporter substrate-binding protein n=1 Tax=Chlorogloeopsis sp. ULAP01 TaxID=3056483 RepID=UPI0025AAB534|nr:iron-siderophore ABC transporter substrate-binding protein [Chlorogloeopsis sp. ULAP01]MDM9382663.1 iron-siderophore ABC transporter substrate-binding protein [Chlorogloeopsis sp. ULAP01]
MKRFLHRFIYLLCLGIVAFMLVCACSQSSEQDVTSPASSAENCRIVQHTMGETCVPLNPQRIVALDILTLGDTVALGIKPIAAGIWSPIEGTIDATPHLADKIKGIALHRFTNQPDLEKILLLKPDLIISASDPSFRGIYKQLSQIAPTVLIPWAEISRDWKQHLKETAKVFDKTEVATQLLNGYYQRVEELKQVLETLQKNSQNNHIQPFYASFAFVSNGLYLAQRNSFAGTILNDLGLLSPKLLNNLALPISDESLPIIDSDVLFVGSYQQSDRSTLERLQRKPLWSKIKAVQQNQVYFVDFQTWYGFDFLAAHAVLDDIEKYLVNTPKTNRRKSVSIAKIAIVR